MTLPTDIESFAFGFDLNSASYSGGAGGTFTNLVSGQQNWTVNGATPSFSTKAGLEGMDFTNDATQTIRGKMVVLREATVLAIFQPNDAGTAYVFGGSNAAANTFGMTTNARRLQSFHPFGGSGLTAAFTSSIPVVGACSWCPANGETAATVYDGTLRKATTIDTSLRDPAIDYFNAMIGGMRTTYGNQWIARVLVFARSLHFRDEDSLDALILTEAAKVGL